MDATQILGSHVPYGVFHGMEGSLVWTLGLLEYFQLCSHFCVKIHRLGHLAGSDKGLSGDAAGDLGARGHSLIFARIVFRLTDDQEGCRPIRMEHSANQLSSPFGSDPPRRSAHFSD